MNEFFLELDRELAELPPMLREGAYRSVLIGLYEVANAVVEEGETWVDNDQFELVPSERMAALRRGLGTWRGGGHGITH